VIHLIEVIYMPGIIRTPLPALATLEDDPLRALRAVRFASRFNFRMSEDILQASASPMVLNSLLHKVSIAFSFIVRSLQVASESNAMHFINSENLPLKCCQFFS
jgi:hypothetical protein